MEGDPELYIYFFLVHPYLIILQNKSLQIDKFDN